MNRLLNGISGGRKPLLSRTKSVYRMFCAIAGEDLRDEMRDESVRSRGTVFLVVTPEGPLQRHYRVPRQQRNGKAGEAEAAEAHKPLTSDDLSDRQKSIVLAREALAVREAVLSNPVVCKRLLVLVLHDKVRQDGLAINGHSNNTTNLASAGEDIASDTFKTLRAKRAALDPIKGKMPSIEETDAYDAVATLRGKKLDRLIDVLLADCLTAHGPRTTPLIRRLAKELRVNVRDHWTPDAKWLSGYQRIQLAHLIGEFGGPASRTAALNRKKSALVEELAALFSQAANAPGGIEDKGLVKRVNAWVPSVLQNAGRPG